MAQQVEDPGLLLMGQQEWGRAAVEIAPRGTENLLIMPPMPQAPSHMYLHPASPAGRKRPAIQTGSLKYKKESGGAMVLAQQYHEHGHRVRMEMLIMLAAVVSKDKGEMTTQIRTRKTRADTTREKIWRVAAS